MAQTGIDAILGIQAKTIFPKRKYIITSFIIGIMLPDLDFIIEYILSITMKYNLLYEYYFFNSIFHSIFIIPFLSLLILIYAEIKKKNDVKIIAIGLSIGMMFHIAIDILTLQPVGIFYPLFDYTENFNLNKYLNINISTLVKKIFYSFEFLFFHIYAWILIQKIIIKPYDNYFLIKKITLWMKGELYVFLLFLLFIYFEMNDKTFMNIFSIFYIPSFVIALYTTYKIRKTLSSNRRVLLTNQFEEFLLKT